MAHSESKHIHANVALTSETTAGKESIAFHLNSKRAKVTSKLRLIHGNSFP